MYVSYGNWLAKMKRMTNVHEKKLCLTVVLVLTHCEILGILLYGAARR
jgi:hypothetical protein